jgi:hypothetical protein
VEVLCEGRLVYPAGSFFVRPHRYCGGIAAHGYKDIPMSFSYRLEHIIMIAMTRNSQA